MMKKREAQKEKTQKALKGQEADMKRYWFVIKDEGDWVDSRCMVLPEEQKERAQKVADLWGSPEPKLFPTETIKKIYLSNELTVKVYGIEISKKTFRDACDQWLLGKAFVAQLKVKSKQQSPKG